MNGRHAQLPATAIHGDAVGEGEQAWRAGSVLVQCMACRDRGMAKIKVANACFSPNFGQAIRAINLEDFLYE